MPLAALPESAGGADAEWSDLFAALRVAGRFSAPIPLAETMLAGWAAASCGLETSDGPMTVGPVRVGRQADPGTRWQWLAAVRRGHAGAVCVASRPGPC